MATVVDRAETVEAVVAVVVLMAPPEPEEPLVQRAGDATRYTMPDERIYTSLASSSAREYTLESIGEGQSEPCAHCRKSGSGG